MNNYNPYYVNPYYQQQQTTPQIQNGGFVNVRSETEARNYPVAPGSSITFFNETQPYCYKKTMGFSPLDHPTFERYKIVKEEVAEEQQTENTEPAWKSDFDSFQTQLDDLRKEVQALKAKSRPASKTKKEEVKDDSE